MNRSNCLPAEMLFRIGIFILILGTPFQVGNSSAALHPHAEILSPNEVISWVGLSSGDWNTPDNWSTESVPGANDDVSIGAGNTVNFSSGTSTINSLNCQGTLTVSGGSFTVSGGSAINELKVKGADAYFDGTTTIMFLYLEGTNANEGVLGGNGRINITSYINWLGAGSDPGGGGRKSSRIVSNGSIVIADSATGLIEARYDGYDAPYGAVRLAGFLDNFGDLELRGALETMADFSELANKPSGSITIPAEYDAINRLDVRINNEGLILLDAPGSFDLPYIHNWGMIKTTGGEINLNFIENSGRLEVNGDGILHFNNPIALINPWSVIVGTGTVKFSDGDGLTDLNVDGVYNVTNTVIEDQDALVKMLPTATVQISNLTVSAGRIELTEPLALNDLTISQLPGQIPGILTGSGPVTVNGTFNWSAGTMEGSGDTSVNGVMSIFGSAVKSLGTSGKPRDLYLNGTGSWSAGDINTSSGSLITIYPGADLTASGTLIGDLHNRGTLQVGTSTGILSVGSNYTQDATGVLNMEIGGAGAGEFDQLNISSIATLGGTLNVGLINGYSLINQGIDILTYGNRNGEFTMHVLPAGTHHTYNANGLTISGGVSIYLPLICKPN